MNLEFGIWKPIEFWNFSTCGNSYHWEEVRPNKVIKAISRKYNGNFKTEIRFKLLHENEVFYSNSVLSTINNSQFEIPEELKKSHVYCQATKVSNNDEDLAERVMFLEPNAMSELVEKDKKWREWITEQNRKRNDKKE